MLPDYDYGMQRSQRPADSEAERIEGAQNGLLDYLAAQIATYNQLYRLEVKPEALKHALECISDVVGDMYAGYAPKPISQVFLETYADAHGLKMEDFGRAITNPATLKVTGVEI